MKKTITAEMAEYFKHHKVDELYFCADGSAKFKLAAAEHHAKNLKLKGKSDEVMHVTREEAEASQKENEELTAANDLGDGANNAAGNTQTDATPLSLARLKVADTALARTLAAEQFKNAQEKHAAALQAKNDLGDGATGAQKTAATKAINTAAKAAQDAADANNAAMEAEIVAKGELELLEQQ